MTNEMIKQIAETMMIKVNMFYLYKEDYKENYRECPWYSELYGMELTLKLMNIDFEFTYDLDTDLITAVTVEGYTVRACDL